MTEQWEIDAALLDGDDVKYYQNGSPAKNKEITLRRVLENLHKHNPGLERLSLPIARRVVPNLLAHELIGVQALSASVDEIHTLRVSMTMNKATLFTPASQSPRLFVSRLKETVTATKTPMNISMTAEELEKITSSNERETEYVEIISKKILDKEDDMLLGNLRQLAGTAHRVFDMSTMTDDATFVGDVHAALAILINRQSNLIAACTRRGAGNRVVISPTALAVLHSASTSGLAKVDGTFGSSNHANRVRYVGTLNGMNLYLDTNAADDEPVFITYKGNEMDAAAIFSPHLPVIFDSDPMLDLSQINISTQNAYHELGNTTLAVANAKDYVSCVGINAATLRFV